jgi:hypothetical protein
MLFIINKDGEIQIIWMKNKKGFTIHKFEAKNYFIFYREIKRKLA